MCVCVCVCNGGGGGGAGERQSKDMSCPDKQKMHKYFHLQNSLGCFINIYTKEVLLCSLGR